MKEKKLDLIIPVYRAHNTLFRTLSSIASQIDSDKILVTLVYDADNIDYSKTISSFSDYIEIKQIRMDKNMGPGAARQLGLESTYLDYVAFMDADDCFATPYSATALIREIESDSRVKIVSSIFNEVLVDGTFSPHREDMVWVFGKIYRRSFLEKYKIHFTPTRANEDTGFNMQVRVCLVGEDERILFSPEITYVWNYKGDSITKINNNEYSYNQNVPGYLYNMENAFSHAKKVAPQNLEYIDAEISKSMYAAYSLYCTTERKGEPFFSQAKNWAARFYRSTFAEVEKTRTKDFIYESMYPIISSETGNIGIANVTFNQFLDELKNIDPEKDKELKLP